MNTPRGATAPVERKGKMKNNPETVNRAEPDRQVSGIIFD
jgi:hypothetical protein